MPDLVGNLEDRFSHDAAHLSLSSACLFHTKGPGDFFPFLLIGSSCNFLVFACNSDEPFSAFLNFRDLVQYSFRDFS